MGTLALIGLGSNLGDRRAILDAAVAALAQTRGVVVRAVSTYHETAPVGGPSGQGPFLNASASLVVSLSPFQLRDTLVQIERDSGRVRVVRWGERTLDMDLLMFGDEVIDRPGLTVPHPRMPFRRFVLAPLAEVAPGACDPLSGRTVVELLALLDRRPSYVAIHRRDIHEAHPLAARLGDFLEARMVPMPPITTARTGNLGLRSALMSRVVVASADLMAGAMEAAGDGWVVSDFWLDGFHHWAIPRLEPGSRDLEAFRSQFRLTRRSAPEPMMVVFPRDRHPLSPCWADRVASVDFAGRCASILRLESEDEDEALGEILAACEASRSGKGNA